MNRSMNAQAVFDCLADATRRRLLAMLVREGELCVCELTAALALEQPKISRHLAVIRDAGLVGVRRSGIWVHYRIADSLPPWVGSLLGLLAKGGVVELEADRTRLGRVSAKTS